MSPATLRPSKILYVSVKKKKNKHTSNFVHSAHTTPKDVQETEVVLRDIPPLFFLHYRHTRLPFSISLGSDTRGAMQVFWHL